MILFDVDQLLDEVLHGKEENILARRKKHEDILANEVSLFAIREDPRKTMAGRIHTQHDIASSGAKS